MSDFTDKTEVADATLVTKKVEQEATKEETKKGEEAAAPAPAASEATTAAAETTNSAATEPAASAVPATEETSAEAKTSAAAGAASGTDKGPTSGLTASAKEWTPKFGVTAADPEASNGKSARTAAALAWVEKDKAAASGDAKRQQDWAKLDADDEDAAKQKAADAAIMDAQLTNQFESALKINNESQLSPEDSHLYVGKDVTWRDPKFRYVAPAILEAIEKDLELPSPSPIQDLTIPHTVAGKSVIAQAQTGSGKSFAFAVTILTRIDASQPVTQAMVVAPTRELALQIVSDAIGPLTHRMNPMPAVEMIVAGGYRPGRGEKGKSQVVVGTSGKIKDLSSSAKKYVDFKTLKILVLDEAGKFIFVGVYMFV